MTKIGSDLTSLCCFGEQGCVGFLQGVEEASPEHTVAGPTMGPYPKCPNNLPRIKGCNGAAQLCQDPISVNAEWSRFAPSRAADYITSMKTSLASPLVSDPDLLSPPALVLSLICSKRNANRILLFKVAPNQPHFHLGYMCADFFSSQLHT